MSNRSTLLRSTRDAHRSPGTQASQEPLEQSAVQVHRAQQSVAARADATVHRIEHGSTLITAGELGGSLEQSHVENQ
jgi:hypothetical protein